MSGKHPEITVEEIKKLVPSAEVYALDATATHIITVDKNALSGSTMREVLKYLNKFDIKAMFIAYSPLYHTDTSGKIAPINPLSIYEVK